MLREALFSTAVISHFFLMVASDCFYPNGTQRDKNTNHFFQPIDHSAPNSMCCRFGGNAPDIWDAAHPGLCISQDENSNGTRLREACTDQTWQAPECWKLCVNEWTTWGGGGEGLKSDASITACSDGSYCCGTGDAAILCCAEKRGVFVVDGATTSVRPSSTASASASPAGFAASTGSSPTASAAEIQRDHKGVSGGTIAGIVVAAVVGTSLIWLVVLVLLRRSSRSRKSAHGRDDMAKAPYEIQSQAIHEMPNPEVEEQRQQMAKVSNRGQE